MNALFTNIENITTAPAITSDSFKLRIHLNEFISYPNILNSNEITTYIDSITGEVIKETGLKQVQKSSFTLDNEITSITVTREKIITSNKGKNTKVETFLTFKITSKLLQTNYYNGIDNTTIKQVYEYIIKQGFVIEYNTFLDSAITDIDYKFDIVMHQHQYKALFEYYKCNARAYKELNKGIDYKDRKNNQGFWFGIRRTSIYTYPFLKVYNKEIELKYKSFEFANEYLEVIIPNLYRFEFTLKDKKHFDKYGIGNTLKQHLELIEKKQSKLYEIFKDFHNIHLNNKIDSNLTKDRNYSNMNEINLSAYIELLIKEKNFGKNAILSYFKNLYSNNTNISKSTIQRQLPIIEKIYNELTSNIQDNELQNKLKNNVEIDKFMHVIGIH